MTHKQWQLDIKGRTVHGLEAGEGPLVLCLHGFPDQPVTFARQLDALANAGFHAVAPYMRGYHPDMLSPDDSYQTAALAREAIELIAGLGYREATVFGHDWGAAVAALSAVLAPETVTALVTAAVPYGNKLGESFITDPAQQRRSWYMFFFQSPLAEMAVAYDELAFIRRLWNDWSPTWDFTDEDIAPVLETLQDPAVLKAALTYYRCALNPDFQKAAHAELQGRAGELIKVPSLHLHGGEDGCIGVDMTAGMGAFFAAEFELEILPDCGHFLHREDPQTVNERLLQFLKRHASMSP